MIASTVQCHLKSTRNMPCTIKRAFIDPSGPILGAYSFTSSCLLNYFSLLISPFALHHTTGGGVLADIIGWIRVKLRQFFFSFFLSFFFFFFFLLLVGWTISFGHKTACPNKPNNKTVCVKPKSRNMLMVKVLMFIIWVIRLSYKPTFKFVFILVQSPCPVGQFFCKSSWSWLAGYPNQKVIA